MGIADSWQRKIEPALLFAETTCSKVYCTDSHQPQLLH